MPKLTSIHTQLAPAAIGPYSQAIVVGDFVYTSGQVALKPNETQLVGTTAAQQAKVALDNLNQVLRAAGSAPGLVVKATVFLSDMNDFPEVNEVYGEFFGNHRPARSTVEVARLPKDAKVEIDCIAAIEQS